MDPGTTGITLDRPELKRLIADCHAGKSGTVVTKDPERLSRDTSQLIAPLDVLRKAGMRIEFSARAAQDSYALPEIVPSAVAELEEATALSTRQSYGTV